LTRSQVIDVRELVTVAEITTSIRSLRERFVDTGRPGGRPRSTLDRAVVTDPDGSEISAIRRSIDVEERVAASSSCGEHPWMKGSPS
jgi:hypothetical protein